MRQTGDDETIDNLGTFKIIQKKKGYRFTEDTVLLADFTLPISTNDTVLDIGTGIGVIPLILAYKSPVKSIVGVEIQKCLAGLASRNIKINNLSKRIKILNCDYRALKHVFKRKSFSVILSNPPYIPKDSGRVCPDRERAIARQEIFGTLSELVHISDYLLKPEGRFLSIFPVSRFKEVAKAVNNAGLEITRLESVHTRRRVKLFLMEAKRN